MSKSELVKKIATIAINIEQELYDMVANLPIDKNDTCQIRRWTQLIKELCIGEWLGYDEYTN